MQRKFAGFDTTYGPDAERERRLTGIPGSFFTQLLPQISNPNELKTLLYFMYLAGQKRGEPKWVGYWELAEADDLISGLRRAGDPRPGIEHLREALELCLARGALVRVEAAAPPPEFFGGKPIKGDLEPVTVTWFLLNTSSNREFLARLERGEVQIEETNLLYGIDLWDRPLPLPENPEGVRNPGLSEVKQWQKQQRWRVRSQRPDIYTLYEQNIGPLTPILSERLREAEKTYPPALIEEAFAEAVNYNRRSWAYISRILENWATNGRERNQERERARTKPAQNNSASYRTGRDGRAPVAGNGAPAPAATANDTAPAGRPTAPNRPRGPIDFTKYTTGKYAHLTQPRPEDSESGS
ncbi:MAG TPA: DnaD domain protein [Chloroflexia bacterium]|nr:DnaD domain protein [Chloroflexia bacterium]